MTAAFSGYTLRPVRSQNSTTASYDQTLPTLNSATGAGKSDFFDTCIARFFVTQHLSQFGQGDNQRRRTHHRTLSTGTAEYWHTRPVVPK